MPATWIPDRLSDLSDITLSSLATNDVLKWNGTAWVNSANATSGTGANTRLAYWSGTNTLSSNAYATISSGSITLGGASEGDPAGSVFLQGQTANLTLGFTGAGLPRLLLASDIALTRTTTNTLDVGTTSARNIINVYDVVRVQPSGSTSAALAARLSGDSQDRVLIRPDGVRLGSGSATTDIVLSKNTLASGVAELGSGSVPNALIVTDYLAWNRQSSTAEQEVARFTPSLPTATDASRTGRLVGSLTDYAATRTWLQVDANGTGLQIALAGQSPSSGYYVGVPTAGTGYLYLGANAVNKTAIELKGYFTGVIGSALNGAISINNLNLASFSGYQVMIAGGHGIHARPNAVSNFAAIFQTLASQTADTVQFQDSSAVVGLRIDKAQYLIIKKTAAPADADLAANEMAIWFDATNGAAKLMIKAKQADGTVRTGNVALA